MPLVTTLDGTQTFGWDRRPAMFPSAAPTLTTPPYTQLEFPLYMRPQSTVYGDVIQAVFKSLRQPPTPLNVAFFSKVNVDRTQEAISDRVAESMGLSIERQSDFELLLIMRRVYMESANNWPDDVPQEVGRLNSMVLVEAVDAVSRNVTRFMSYMTSFPQVLAMADPAELVTSRPLEAGTPAPLRDLNADYERGVQGFMVTRPPRLFTPAP